MKARSLTLAALAALVTACGGGGEEGPQAGDSAEPGATGTIDNTGPEMSGTPVDTLTATDATTAGANGSPAGAQPSTAAPTPAPSATTPPNAPPATATPATEGDTAHGAGH